MDKHDVRDILEGIKDLEELRQELLPTEREALRIMFECYQRLKELGWREAAYMPIGQEHQVISAGSTGIHMCHKDERRRYWVSEANDFWPASPILYKPKEEH